MNDDVKDLQTPHRNSERIPMSDGFLVASDFFEQLLR
jgi:hypothetical protein